MKILFTAMLLLGCLLGTTALAQPTPVSLPLPVPTAGEETVGDLAIEGEWG